MVCQAKTGTWNTAGHDAGRAATGAARGALGKEAAADAAAAAGGGAAAAAAGGAHMMLPRLSTARSGRTAGDGTAIGAPAIQGGGVWPRAAAWGG